MLSGEPQKDQVREAKQKVRMDIEGSGCAPYIAPTHGEAYAALAIIFNNRDFYRDKVSEIHSFNTLGVCGVAFHDALQAKNFSEKVRRLVRSLERQSKKKVSAPS